MYDLTCQFLIDIINIIIPCIFLRIVFDIFRNLVFKQ